MMVAEEVSFEAVNLRQLAKAGSTRILADELAQFLADECSELNASKTLTGSFEAGFERLGSTFFGTSPRPSDDTVATAHRILYVGGRDRHIQLYRGRLIVNSAQQPAWTAESRCVESL